jgi:hypothetical protein
MKEMRNLPRRRLNPVCTCGHRPEHKLLRRPKTAGVVWYLRTLKMTTQLKLAS